MTEFTVFFCTRNDAKHKKVNNYETTRTEQNQLIS